LKRLGDADGETAEAGDVFRAEAGSDSAAVLIVIPSFRERQRLFDTLVR